MATRRPLVIVGNTIAEIPNGDSLPTGVTVSFPSATAVTGGQSGAFRVIEPAVAPSAGGALTANVWKSVVSVSGRGIFNGAAVRCGGSTSKTVGVRVTIDGVVAGTFELAAAQTSGTCGAWAGMLICGGVDATSVASFGFAPFNTSLLIEIRSNIATSEPTYGVYYTVLAP